MMPYLCTACAHPPLYFSKVFLFLKMCAHEYSACGGQQRALDDWSCSWEVVVVSRSSVGTLGSSRRAGSALSHRTTFPALPPKYFKPSLGYPYYLASEDLHMWCKHVWRHLSFYWWWSARLYPVSLCHDSHMRKRFTHAAAQLHTLAAAHTETAE